jgi:hypothetical protein
MPGCRLKASASDITDLKSRDREDRTIKPPILKQFISVHDVPDIDALVNRALNYKSDPLRSKSLAQINALVVFF